MTKAEIVVSAADGQLGSPYVYGTWGQLCTVALRKRYARYNPQQEAVTFRRCQRLRPSKPVDTCDGCPYQGRLAYDCRGFTHWCMKKAGIDITGGYVGRQWSDPNWMVKGDVEGMPAAAVACLFTAKMDHTGLHLGSGRVVHCSVEVKEDTLTGRAWKQYGIPKGLYEWTELLPYYYRREWERMLKKGSKGDDVRSLQAMLNALGYDAGTADGIYGNKTVAAVKAFQGHEALNVDGIAGPRTLEILAMRCATAGADAGRSEDPEYDVDPDDPEAVLPPAVIPDEGAKAMVMVPQEDLYEVLKIVRELSGRLEAWVE